MAEHVVPIGLYGFAGTLIAAVSVAEFSLADATVNDSLHYAAMTSGGH
jgi:hypothetical protein